MGSLKNTWISTITRSYDQIVQAIVNGMKSKVKEINDFNETNPYIREVTMYAGLGEQFGYYNDNAYRESFVDSARIYASLVSHAMKSNYRIMTYRPYGTQVQFSIASVSSTITIPAGTVVKIPNTTINYTTQATVTIPAGQLTSPTVLALQYVAATLIDTFASNGLPDQEFELSQNVADGLISVNQGGVTPNETWYPVNTLAFSMPLDQHFVLTVNENGRPCIYFGDGQRGSIPLSNLPIEVRYAVTLGSQGGAGLGQITEIVTGLTLPFGVVLKVTNVTSASGGADVETIDELKQHIPYANRTLERAVTKGDYIAMAQLVPGVAKAGGSYSCSQGMELYIVPLGGGVANASLINNTYNYIDYHDIILVKLKVRAAGEVHIVIVADVNANPGAFNATVEADVKASLTGFFNYINQQISGTVVIGDIYQYIENTKDVLNSKVVSFKAIPYARPSTTSSPILLWTVNTPTTSAGTINFKIQFTSSTTFRVIRGSTLVGTYNTGVLVALPEVEFTISNNGYTSGLIYDFVTYPYNPTSLILKEPSLPVSVAADLTINVTGGL